MIIARALWISFIAAVALTGALSACATDDESTPRSAQAQCYWLSDGAGWVASEEIADPELCFQADRCTGGLGQGYSCHKWATAADAPGVPWAALGFAAPPREEAACYRQIDFNGEGGWDYVDGREGQCFQRDYCSGGMGMGDDAGRPCFKWAMGPNEPALPWSAALTGPQQRAADIPPPEEIYEDEFEMTGDSCYENCEYPARVASETPIYARPDPSSPRIGVLSADECVQIEDFSSLSSPVRGVVLETHGQFTAGDVIYNLAYEGEGQISIWRRGERLTAFYDEVVAQWDTPSGPADPRVGQWHELTRSNGTRGWAKSLETSDEACTFVRR